MFFRKWIFDSYKYRFQVQKNEINKNILKSLLSCEEFSLVFRIYFFKLFQKYPKFSSISFFRRYCNLTGYSKSVFRLFKLSRHQAKKYASNGFLMGMRKSSF